MPRLCWQIGICSPSSPVTKSKMFIGVGEPLAKPQSDSCLKKGDWVFGLAITATLDEVMPVVSPLFEGCHRFSLQELRGWATSHPRDVITMPSVGPTSHWHQNSSQDFRWESVAPKLIDTRQVMYMSEVDNVCPVLGCICRPGSLHCGQVGIGWGFIRFSSFLKMVRNQKFYAIFLFLNTGNNF